MDLNSENRINKLVDLLLEMKEVDKHSAWKRIDNQLFLKRRRLARAAMLSTGVAAMLALALLVFTPFGTDVDTDNAPLLVEHTVPGSKATLILSDGSEINLDRNTEGYTEAGAEIVGDGSEVVYKGADAANVKLIYNTIIIPRGGEYRLTLADGTQIWLNADTKLRFPVNFAVGERRVFLDGEAYFKVTRDTKRPFIVESPKQQVEVLGTEFCVNSYSDNSEVLTTLVEGSVSVKADKRAKGVVLIPGEQSRLNVDNGNITTQEVNINGEIAWKNGQFYFNKETLSEVVKKIERWYDIDLVVDKSAADMIVVGSIDRYESVLHVMDMLKLTGEMDYSIENQKIIIYRKK